jgi:DNA-binding NtrC family response regulator
MKKTILLVEDEKNAREALKKGLSRKYAVIEAANGEEGLAAVKDHEVDLIISDVKMPKMDGLEFLKKARLARPGVEIIMITAFGNVQMAVEAMKQGAGDFLEKPLDLEQIRMRVEKAFENQELYRENAELKARLKDKFKIKNMIGTSAALDRIYGTISQVAPSRASVLITGESGTGKELIANAIHYASDRADGPLVKVNCSSLVETLLESELFGHVKGAFTGAISDKKGRFEAADGGTLFLDEIGDISPNVQVKLLRVLQEHTFERVGSTEPITVDVRVISATNQNLKAKVDAGKFREDLYYRLHVVALNVPPLRERREDIPLLADHFLRKYAAENNKNIKGITREALSYLERYDWPGNIRHLENVIESAVVLAKGDMIVPELLPSEIHHASEQGDSITLRVGIAMSEAEKELIRATLQATGGNKTKAAKTLKIGARTLYRKIEEYGL